jgi:uncharacterized protein involved in exopolysaccharide biosynthesis
MGGNFGLRDALRIFFKHKYKMVVVFLLVAAGAYIMARQTPQFFKAKAVIMVNLGREFVPIPEVTDMRVPAPSHEAIMNTERELITGRELTSTVISTMGIENVYPESTKNKLTPEQRQEIAVQKFSKSIQAKRVGGSNMIEVYFQSDNPKFAADALRALIESLKDRHLQVFRNVNFPFLQEQLAFCAEKLQDAQNRLAGFKQANKMFSGDEHGNALVGQRIQLNTQLMQETSRLSELKQKLHFVKSRPAIFYTNTGELRTQLNILRRKEQDLAQKFRDESTVILAVRDDIRLVEQQLNDQEKHLRDAEYYKIEADIKAVEIRVASLTEQIRRLDGEIHGIGRSSVELQDLKRQVAENESNYRIYLKKVEEARISDNMDQKRMTNITIVQEPSVPSHPVGPNRQKTFNMGLLAALLFSVAIGVAFEYIPQVFQTPDAVVQRLKIPLLATIDHRES